MRCGTVIQSLAAGAALVLGVGACDGGGKGSGGAGAGEPGGAGGSGASGAGASGPNPTPPPTEKGTSLGAKLTKTLGAAGGTIVSADGRLTITFPAGALATDTEIGIEPITNKAP